jgi:hypothetical protein
MREVIFSHSSKLVYPLQNSREVSERREPSLRLYSTSINPFLTMVQEDFKQLIDLCTLILL